MNKKSEASIGLIVAAVIGLIILTVLILLLSGKLSLYSKSVEESKSCDVFCDSINMKKTIAAYTKTNCENRGHVSVSGEFSDRPSGGCCCKNP